MRAPPGAALTSRSDMGVLSSSGRCCSSARTMQLAMMVAKIMYSKGVRPSQGKRGTRCGTPSWGAGAGQGLWGPHGAGTDVGTEGLWGPRAMRCRQSRGPGAGRVAGSAAAGATCSWLINFPIKGATRRPRLPGTTPLARREPALIKAPQQQRDPGRPTRHPRGPGRRQQRHRRRRSHRAAARRARRPARPVRHSHSAWHGHLA